MKDKRLSVSAQKYEKLKKLLMVYVLSDSYPEEDADYAAIYNFLAEVFEYRKDYEINVNADDEAQEEIIHIIAAADYKDAEVTPVKSDSRKRRVGLLLILALIISGISLAQAIRHTHRNAIWMVHTDRLSQVITPSEEAEIKSLVWRIVELESQRGKRISHTSLYNEIKALPNVSALNDVSSYKKFNHGQYIEARKYLENRVSSLSAD